MSWDVVVIGYGYAGAMAAIEARDAGASVLLLEKMAEPGGISICSAGGVRIAFDAEGALDYLEATNAGTTPTSVLRGLAEEMVEPPDRLRELARVNAARVEVRPAKGNYPFPGHESFGFAELLLAVCDAFGVKVSESYGLTEGGPVMIREVRLRAASRWPRSAFRKLWGGVVRRRGQAR